MKRVIRALKTPVTMILLLAFVGYGAYWGYQHVTTPIAPRAAVPCVPTDVGGELTPDYVTIRVLNGGERGGFAKVTSERLRAFGFTINRVNNTTEQVENTVIVGLTADDPQVKLLLNFFNDATARGDGRVDGIIDVLVGNKTSAPDQPAAKSVPVSGPVCVAAKSTTSATPSETPTESASPSTSPSESPTKKAKKKK